jgi:hypothetical protein
MINHGYLKPALSGLAKLKIALDKKGGPAEDNFLFENILNLQNNILKSFGLPPTPENLMILWFDRLPSGEELEERTAILHKTAADYLTQNAVSELRTLREAILSVDHLCRWLLEQEEYWK